MLATELSNGVVIGLLLGFRDGQPLVVYAGNPEDTARPARSLAALSADDLGCEVALLFEEGKADRPLIVGRIVDPARVDRPKTSLSQDSDAPIVISSRKSMEFRCGKASIVMKADGTVTIRGTQILSKAERGNRVQGATVSLN